MSPDWGARVHESARASPVIIVICDCLESDGPLSNCPEDDSLAPLSVFNRIYHFTFCVEHRSVHLSCHFLCSYIDFCVCSISRLSLGHFIFISTSAPSCHFLDFISVH